MLTMLFCFSDYECFSLCELMCENMGAKIDRIEPRFEVNSCVLLYFRF